MLFMGCVSQPLWAASSASDAAQIQALETQTQQLQAQLAALQKQLVVMQQQQAKIIRQQQQVRTQTRAQVAAPVASAVNDNDTAPPAAVVAAHEALSTAPEPIVPRRQPASPLVEGRGTRTPGRVTAYEQNVTNVVVAESENNPNRVPYGEHALANLGGFAVITSPYLHPQMAYDGGDLIVNFSSIYKDANILQQRQTFQHAMYDLGYGMPRAGSLLELSGEIEGQANTGRRGFSNSPEGSLDLTDAELDMQILMNRWITGFMSFSYNNFPTSSGNRAFASQVQLNNGFITFGDLDITKWRLSMGQMYIPFGSYNSFMVTDPINKTLFRTLARPILLGYGVPGTPGFNGSIYAFQGTTFVGHVTPATAQADTASWNQAINQYGADASYQFNINPHLKTTWGGSFIANVADSNGMQSTGRYINSPNFQGFSNNSGSQVLAHKVPGLDGRGEVDIYDVSLIGEYTTATTAFSPLNATFNGHGAKPSAWHVEGVYSFSPWDKPSTFALGFDQSYQSLAFNVPEQSFGATWNISIWRNTLLSLELRHNINYSSDDTASGDLGPIFNPNSGSSNIATVQFQVFF